MPDRPPLDPYVATLEGRMAAATPRRSRADLGRALGLDSSQVTRIFKGARRLQVHEIRQIDEWLGQASDSLLLPTHGNVVAGPGMVPLVGRVGASSGSKLTFAEEDILSYVPMHPAQIHVRQPFALQVDDVSMHPRYRLGEIAYIAPFTQPKPHQDAVIVTTEGYGFLKEFLTKTPNELVTYQLNPEGELKFSLKDVAQLHSVVGRG